MNIARLKPFYLLKNEQSDSKSIKFTKNKTQNLVRFWVFIC
jgi:hypothetical protein